MKNAIRPQPGILDIALYRGRGGHVAGVANALKLSSNENPFGPSDKAKEAFSRSVHQLHRYPNTDHAALRSAIAEVHGLDAGRVICGVGSDEIIHFLCQAYAGPGDEVLFTEHGFLMYRISAMAAGATPVEVPERERTTDVDALLAACTKRTRLVFIANPNNPTGTMIRSAEVARLADGLPPQAILVLDGAYAEYVDGYRWRLALIETRENVVMTRTFSKIYGLGGPAHRLGLWPARDHRGAEPDPGAVQSVERAAGYRRGGGARSGLRRPLPCRQCPPAGLAGRGAGRDWACRPICRWPISCWRVLPMQPRPRPAMPICNRRG